MAPLARVSTPTRIASGTLAAAVLASGRLTAAPLPIRTLAGRQIGDGRAATAASLDRPFGVAFAPDEALLIADRLHSRIRRVDPATGVITTIVGTRSGSRNEVPADQGELQGPLRVRVDQASGDLIITDREQHTIRRVLAATGVLGRLAGSPDNPGGSGDGGPATAALLNGPTDAFPDGGGGILVADRLNHRVRRIDPAGNITTVAGSGVAGYAGDGIPLGATLARLNAPSCVLPVPAASGGGFFVCDEQNHVIRLVSGFGTITTVAGTGVAGFADGPATAGQLNQPVNLAFDGLGNVLIADLANHRIRRLDLAAGTLSTIAGTGTGAFTPDGAPAATSALFGPTSVTLAPDGPIVFTEDGSHRVRAIDQAGNLVTLAGDGVNRFGGDGGPPLDAQFGLTTSVSRDRAGRFVVTDFGNARVRRIDPCTGLVETIAGSGDVGFGGDGGPALEAGMSPIDAVQDADGNLFIPDTNNDRIRKVDPFGTITTVVGLGVRGYAGDGGPATAALINRPWGIELDASGAFYIADFENHAVRRVADGIITTLAGTGVAGYNGDAIPATSAMLTHPIDVAVDAAGNLYIADHHNHRIRRVDAATQLISTVAGTGVPGFGGDGGLAVLAQMQEPGDVKIDETGAVWFTDFENQRVRRFAVGGVIETVAGTGLRGYAGDGGLATDARLLFPLGLLVVASDQVAFTERESFIVRGLGTIPVDCNRVPDDCRGPGARSCIPGGNHGGQDCFGEFKLPAPLPSGMPSSRLSCVDGDAACDADDVPGRCTFRVALCLNNEDQRLGCAPAAITSVRLKGRQARGAGGQALLAAARTFGSSYPIAGGRGVAFVSTLGARNQCTPFEEFVVQRRRRAGKSKLGALITTQASGQDASRLKLVCLAP
jgi:sugar lactone lactonase YvrE